jgi:hypothetical protein
MYCKEFLTVKTNLPHIDYLNLIFKIDFKNKEIFY